MKTYINIAILVIVSGIVIYWAVNLSSKVDSLQVKETEDRQAIQQVVQFISQNAKK